MIMKEFHSTRKDGVNLFKTYSDQGLMIKKVGTEEVYKVAIDVEDSTFAYEETEDPIETEEV